jgi:putative NADH-flavin reductase
MKIVVIGATGPTGQAITELALKQGLDVTCMARHPEAMTMQDAHLTVVRGDVLDPASLDKAVAGQEAVICALGISIGASRKPTTIYSEGTKHIVNAMNKHRVSRLLCITGIGAGDSRGHGGFFYDRIFLPFVLNEGYKDKTRQEEVIRQTTLNWTIIRPAMLTKGPAKGSYRVIEGGDYVAKSIARADLADFIVKSIAPDKYSKKTVLLTY